MFWKSASSPLYFTTFLSQLLISYFCIRVTKVIVFLYFFTGLFLFNVFEAYQQKMIYNNDEMSFFNNGRGGIDSGLWRPPIPANEQVLFVLILYYWVDSAIFYMNFDPKFFLKMILIGVIWCGESILCIPKFFLILTFTPKVVFRQNFWCQIHEKKVPESRTCKHFHASAMRANKFRHKIILNDIV